MNLRQILKLPLLTANSAGQSQPGVALAGAARSDARQAKLSKAAEAWREVHRLADQRIAELKAAIVAHYASDQPGLVAEVEKGASKLDAILDNVDHSLADILADAAAAVGEAAMKVELQNAKARLAQYIGYVKGEPLVAHMDRNPFGVKTELKALLAAGLADAAKAIG